MAIFKTEKELNDYLEQGIRGLMAKYDMPENEIENGIDFCRTLMAEYSRLLQEGKIKRPITHSAVYERGDDGAMTLLNDLLYGRKVSKSE